MTSKASKLRIKRIQRKCSIPGCGRPHRAKGLCNKHRQRDLSHGNPLSTKTGRAGPGEAQEFYVNNVLTYDGDECLIWPYAKSDWGYATMHRGGEKGYVSRFLCEDTHGPAPTPEHQAAHSCGRGDEGCVTKRHLSWKTPSENCQDKFVHGTHTRGERSGTAKLTEDQVKAILALQGKATRAVIGEKFGVSGATIYNIHSRQTWAWVKLDEVRGHR